MIRVLQDLSSLDGGGVAKLLYEYYRNMDHEMVHFDFLIYNYYEEGIYEKPLEKMGCRIFKVPTFQQDKKSALREIDRIIKDGHYDCVHSHFGRLSYFVLRIAKKYNVAKRIAHSHIAFEPMRFQAKIAAPPRAFITKMYATHLFACGNDAGQFMWGRKAVQNGSVKIMKNAIDTEAYRYSEESRIKKRKELGIENEFVLGIVGRLSTQKNYPYLFNVYARLLKSRSNVVLLVVGRGPQEETIRKQAESMGLQDRIQFLGVRKDVPELLNAFDVFLLPSLYEGLPVVLIEAQANGVKAVISDQMTSEMIITDLITQLPIAPEDTDRWVTAINSINLENTNRADYADEVANAGYDIRKASCEMMNFYLS